jgi:hypothetical protein
VSVFVIFCSVNVYLALNYTPIAELPDVALAMFRRAVKEVIHSERLQIWLKRSVARRDVWEALPVDA